MGLFRSIKENITFRREMKKLMKAYEEKMQAYVEMSSEEFRLLPDEELYDAAIARVQAAADAFGDEDEDMQKALAAMNPVQRTVFVVDCLEREVNNGGLCQFFVNSSRNTAPYVSESLDAIIAIMHKELFDDFIADNNIDVHDLTSFIIYDVEEFAAQCERYPFDSFDEKFYEYGDFEAALTTYIKENIESF